MIEMYGYYMTCKTISAPKDLSFLLGGRYDQNANTHLVDVLTRLLSVLIQSS